MIKDGKNNVCIIIPLYKAFHTLSVSEVSSLTQCFVKLGNYPICFVYPLALEINGYMESASLHASEATGITFDDEYFKNIEGYNKLLLSTAFYESFNDYKYIFIYQLDAWVFTDELEQWCNKGYDYVGAPWINENVFSWTGLFPFWMKWYYKIKYNRATMPLVGNGGLSLRNVQACLSVLNKHQEAVAKWSCHEDLFWSFYTIYKEKWFSIPSTKEAVAFAFEFNPDAAYELNNHQLPFGCHAWEKYNPSFWNKFIPVQ